MSGNPYSRATPGRGHGTALGRACLAAFALCVPRSWFDPVLLAHTTLMTMPFDPGLPYTLTPRWMNTLVTQLGDRVAPALQTVLLLVAVAVCIQRIRRRSRERAATPVPGLPSPAEAGAE